VGTLEHLETTIAEGTGLDRDRAGNELGRQTTIVVPGSIILMPLHLTTVGKLTTNLRMPVIARFSKQCFSPFYHTGNPRE
jgi:hypothetical protein